MAVPEQTPYKEYIGNGVTTNFALGFTCDLKQELKVFINDIEPELSTWSLTGGSVSFTTAPTLGSKIAFKRATKLERTTNYLSSNNSFRPEAINKDFDRVWYAIQDQNYKVGQYDFDYAYAVNTSNQALSDAATAQQRADDAYDLADTTNTEIRDIERGGTGAGNPNDARNNLNTYSKEEVNALIATGGAGSVVGIAGGGTGATTKEQARENLDVPSTIEVATAIEDSLTPNATETVVGKAKIATTVIAQEGTNDTDIITPLKLQQKLTSTVFGEGQAWVDVTSQRLENTTYTNTTGKPLLISVVTRPNAPIESSSVHLIVDGKIIIGSSSYGSNIYVYNGASTIVPKDKTYSFSIHQQNYLYFLEFS